MGHDTDIRVVEAEPWFRYLKARTPMKFGGVVMESAVYQATRVVVQDRRGRRAEGWGAIPLADLWGWPSPSVPHDLRERIMGRLAHEVCQLAVAHTQHAHPIPLMLEIEQDIFAASDRISLQMGAAELQPKLNALIPASAVDAAIHDAYGNLLGLDVYKTYTAEFMPDLSTWLGPQFAGKYPADYLKPGYDQTVPAFHLVGGLDPLTVDEVPADAPADGLPNAFTEWVARDGLVCLKIKWRGIDAEWDIRRTLDVYRLAMETHAPSRPQLFLSGDTNEQCETPEYMVEVLSKIREASQEVFDALLYIEQPTHRDLWAHPHDFTELAKLKPVVVDESLTDLAVLERALELGATGIALKTCKGQSNDMLYIAKAAETGAMLAVQDLTCSGLSLLHSIGLAARTHVVMGVEYNSRQYFPKGSDEERKAHSDLLDVREGHVSTASLTGPGLGFQMAKMTPPDRLEGTVATVQELQG